MKTYPNLMSPVKVGNITIKNRYAVGPMGGRHFIYADKGQYSLNGIDYWVRRAQGGFGLITTGSNYGDQTVDGFDPINGNRNPLYAKVLFKHGAEETLRRVHAYGAKMFLQLGIGPGRMRQGKSCSEIPVFKDPSKNTTELTKEEIETLINGVIDLAVFAKECGYDGVEVHGMHWGYLLDQFAMAYTNHRTDEYGGDLYHRLTVVRKIITGIKERCGKDYPVSVRLSMKTFMAGYNKSTLDGKNELGRDIDETIEIVKLFEQWGVDMLNVNTGTYDTFYYCVGPYYMPKGYNIEYAAKIKAAVNIPVFLAGKMQDPDMCEQAIIEGKIDGVTLARASLVDPSYPAKVFQGRPEKARPCISCANCIETNLAGGCPLCSANPHAMNDYNYGIDAAKIKKNVVVVGGGVSGMEAALTAAERGHKVSLYEASNHLGGHLTEAGSHPFKDGIADLNKWYQSELADSSVEIHLNTPLDADKIKAMNPDAVILAVGSYHFMPPIPGIDHAKSVNCYDALMKNVKIGDKVVVVGGGMTGCELAYDLAEYEGKEVTLVEALPDIMSAGPKVPMAVDMMLRDLLKKNEVTLKTGHRIAEINDEGAVVLDADNNKSTIEADTVIMAIGLKPNKDISTELAGAGIEVYKIGDARQVGNIQTCTSMAYEIARAL